MKAHPAFTSIDDYIKAAAPKARPILRKIRALIRKAVPGAQGEIRYQMPAFRKGRVFIYFAAFKAHVGIFPPVKGDPKLQAALERYRGPKGNLRFPMDEPMPYALIRRVAVTLAKAHAKPG